MITDIAFHGSNDDYKKHKKNSYDKCYNCH